MLAGLHATAVHPGGILTQLARHLDPALVKGMVTPEMELQLKSPEQGAATTVWAAVSKTWEGTGGGPSILAVDKCLVFRV